VSKFIFRIGPIEFSGERTYFYYVYPWQDDNFFFMANSDEDGFEKILEVYTPSDLECEPELAEICTCHNITTGEITPERAYNIILMGLESIEGQHFKDILRGGLICQFGGAAADFWQSQPWNKNFAKHHLQFEFSGSVHCVLYGFVMGEGTQEYGITLYKTREDLETILEPARNYLLGEASTVEALGVTLQDEPLSAAHAMWRAYGVNKIPIPVAVRDGERCFINDLDILMLTAALEAVAVMDDSMQFAIGRVTVEDLAAVCRVILGPNLSIC
jgi:hypothetical protein